MISHLKRDSDRKENSRSGSGKDWARYTNVGVFLRIAAVPFHRPDSRKGCGRAEVLVGALGKESTGEGMPDYRGGC